MKHKYLFRFYTIIWVIALASLFYLLWNINGDARTINYGGIVRGSTQKLIKEELYGMEDDETIAYIDAIIYDLQTGDGYYQLVLNTDETFQAQLSTLDELWSQIKDEIYLYRDGDTSQESLFELSQQHYTQADEMVHYLETDSDTETGQFIALFCLTTIIVVSVFIYIYEYSQKVLTNSISTDYLTHLMNRFGFEHKIKELLKQNPQIPFTIIKLDIDNFKLINTTYDYNFGDRLLCCIADALSDTSSNHCAYSHLDADNFLLLIKQKDDIIPTLDSKLRSAVGEYDVSRLFSEIKFTYGAYNITANTEPFQTILTKVTLAHKAAKGNEFSSYSWYSQDLLAKIEQETYYTEHIDQSIANHEFKLYLQSQVNLDTLEVISAESLVRWQRDDGAFIYPDAFIPLFEKNGIISKIDFHMLELVCQFLAKQRDSEKPLFQIAVNISRVTLSHTDFLQQFIEIVDRYHIPHKYIEVEVTESALIQLGVTTSQILHDLRALDFSIAMDDFGAGYSNLSSLSTLPVHVLKLDKQFLWGIDTNEKMTLIITNTVNLAHSMGITVICEGVEQESHVAFLKSIGCEYAQGYYFARPIPSEEFEQTIISSPYLKE